jgi:type II secretory pathway component GspD/PulD (secretin)
MIWVKDRTDVVDRVGVFLASVNKSMSISVSINGVITEVDLKESEKFGIDWTVAGENLTRAGASIAKTGNVLGGTSGANFTLAWTNGGNRTTSYINALKQFGDVNVISRPSIRVANNAIGSLIIGRNTSYVAEVEATASSSDTTRYASKLKSLQTGLNFYVLPHIISDTEAILYISPELTSLQEIRLISGGVGTPNVEAPTITMRQTQTVVPIRNGESLIIGGLMAETNNKNNGKTTGLGDVPLLGGLFQTEDSNSGLSEFSLMVNVSW